MFIQLSVKQNKLLVNVFMATSSAVRLSLHQATTQEEKKRETHTGTEKREPL
jgi:hypothetical protein